MLSDPTPTAAEREMLAQYFDFQHQALLDKAAGLTQAQLAWRHAPSYLSIGGILNHIALVEDSWLQTQFLGLPDREPWAGVDWDADPNWEFRTAADLSPERLRQRYLDACARSLTLLRTTDLNQLSATPRRDGQHFSLRWVILRLTAEAARHAGHADLIREAIDGTVGWN